MKKVALKVAQFLLILGLHHLVLHGHPPPPPPPHTWTSAEDQEQSREVEERWKQVPSLPKRTKSWLIQKEEEELEEKQKEQKEMMLMQLLAALVAVGAGGVSIHQVRAVTTSTLH